MGFFKSKKTDNTETKIENINNKKNELLNIPVDKHNLHEIANKVAVTKELNKEEITYLLNGIVRLSNLKDAIIGLSLGKIIEIQKEYELRQVANQFKNAVSRIDMLLNHSFKYIGLQPNDNEEKNNDLLFFEIGNTSDKEIVALQGTLEFFNFQNILLKTYFLDLQANIKPGTTAQIGNQFDNDPKNPIDMVIRSKAKVNLVWSPKSITYSDGTVVEDNSENNK